MVGEGNLLMVMDQGKHYACSILQRSGDRVEVHYTGWNSRYDEWISLDSPRIVWDDVDDRLHVDEGCGKRKRGGDVEEDGPIGHSSRKRLASELGSGALSSGPGDDAAVDGGDSTLPIPSPVTVPVAVSGTVSPGLSGASRTDASKCALCFSLIGGRSTVGCGDCNKVFHADRLCLGVDQPVIDVLLGGDSCAVKYVCCSCRASPKCGVSGEVGGFSQMLNIIGGLVSDMRKLTESVSKLQGSQEVVPSNGVRVQNVTNKDDTGAGIAIDKSLVMSEVREMYEREKRKDSVIIRGVGDVSVQQASSIFRDMCQYLGLGNVPLVDTVKVAPSVFRGKILKNEMRFRLLAEARKLRNSANFRQFYIQKDLTYRQRGELIANRAAARENLQEVESGNVRHVSSSSPRRGASRGRGTSYRRGMSSNVNRAWGHDTPNGVPLSTPASVVDNVSGEDQQGIVNDEIVGNGAWQRVGNANRGRGARGRNFPPPMATRHSRRNENLN